MHTRARARASEREHTHALVQRLSDLRRVFQEMESDADGKVTYAQVRLGGGGCV